MNTPIVITERQPGCLITLLWFVFIGWWLSAFWSVASWLLILSVIGMPLGFVMINRLPMVATLRRPASEYRVQPGAEGAVVVETPARQRPFVLRAAWFILAGWWLSASCLIVAWLASSTLFGLPIAIWLYNRIPALTTLAHY
jgi:uncharacterized membrane protein YccF (DUF307 family)